MQGNLKMLSSSTKMVTKFCEVVTAQFLNKHDSTKMAIKKNSGKDLFQKC